MIKIAPPPPKVPFEVPYESIFHGAPLMGCGDMSVDVEVPGGCRQREFHLLQLLGQYDLTTCKGEDKSMYYNNFLKAPAYLSTFENFPGVESARQLVSDILPIARGCYK